MASRVLELQIGYVLYMLSTTAGRIEVRGDTNASFRISRLPISIDPKAAVVSRRKPPWNVLSHKPPRNF